MSAHDGPRQKVIFYRIVAPLAALLLFFLFSSLYALGYRDTYTDLLSYWGFDVAGFPFVDTSGMLAAWQCTRLGAEIIEHNPCDLLGRPYNYSPLWLAASAIPLDVTWTSTVGWALAFVFLLSLVFLPPPRRPWESVVVVLATVSTSVAFAVERGNFDIVVFLMALLAGFLALRAPPARLLAYVVALLAGMLKYYPVTLLILTFRERAWTFLAVNSVVVSLITLFVAYYFSDLARIIPLVTSGTYYTDLFGAKNLPLGLAEILRHFAEPSAMAPMLSRLVAGAVYVLLLLAGAAICGWILRLPDLRTTMSKLTEHEATFLVIGSVLIVGCFFAGQSIAYRGIFLLMVLPGLLALSRNATTRALRALGASTSVLVVFLLWGEFVRKALGLVHISFETTGPGTLVATGAFWLFRELAWWAAVTVMAALLLDFLSQTETARTLSAAFKPYLARLRDGTKRG
jgi:hypothetical protein